MELGDKKIVFIDDDLSILHSFEKYCNALFPNNKFEYYSKYGIRKIDDSVDILVSDFYIGQKQNVPEFIRDIRKRNNNVIILVVSSAVVIKDGNYTCYNNSLLKDSISAGANNVLQKDLKEIIKMLEHYITVRQT